MWGQRVRPWNGEGLVGRWGKRERRNAGEPQERGGARRAVGKSNPRRLLRFRRRNKCAWRHAAKRTQEPA